MTARRAISNGILDVLGGLPLFLTAPLYRHWHLRWGATEDEVRGPMPGDELVPKAPFTATRAVTIDAPPSAVWPWIVQMGYRRAGFYTYDLLDNAGFESADVVLEEYQNPQVGDWMPMASKVNETTAFKVRAFESNRWLLWEKPDSTWAWRLAALPNGGTRLITRLKQRYQWESPAIALFTLVLLEFGDFPMMRRVLRGHQVAGRAGQPGRGRSRNGPHTTQIGLTPPSLTSRLLLPSVSCGWAGQPAGEGCRAEANGPEVDVGVGIGSVGR